jgi:peptidoglycan/xylan/chitin deacetylase (PgdA/CDA1 family)
LKILALFITVSTAILLAAGSTDQPLDAIGSTVSPSVDLPPAPYLDALGVDPDQQEVAALPLADEPNTYLDVFNFKPEEAGLPAPKSGYSVSILMYHGFTVGPAHSRYQTSAADFRAQLEYLRQNEIPVIRLGDLADAYNSGDWSKIPTQAVVITIDDGQHNAYTIGFPILKEFNAPFTLAIYTNYVASRGTLSWNELKEMMAAGAEIGCHTKSHANLKRASQRLTGDAFRRFMESETIASRKILEEGTGAPVRYFFYPYGSYSRETQAFLVTVGYDCILTTNDGFCTPKSQAYALDRNEVYEGISIAKYRTIASKG